ncbi:MAG: hypothetical protein ACOC92_00595 [bacterium]
MRIALPILLLALGPCHSEPPEPDPTPALASLRSDTYEPSYGLEYWNQALNRDDREWNRAVQFCSEHNPERYPNCRTILLLHTASRIPGFREDLQEPPP